MKNFFTLAAYALLAVALPLTFTACGSDDDDKESFDKTRFKELTYSSQWMTESPDKLFEGKFDHEYVTIRNLDPLNPSKINIYVLHEVDHEIVTEMYPNYEGTIKQNAKRPWLGTVTLRNLHNNEDIGTWNWNFPADENGNHDLNRFALQRPDGTTYTFTLFTGDDE
ncbi:MAG: hypothetical protein J6M53_09220 [Bacteroidaceae bacterium]|nr:hypothetical protein [Bacteroidaceae bacterium]